MSDDVTRYTMSVEFDADVVVDPWYAVPEKDSLGSWVRHSDYEALRQRCERAEAERLMLAKLAAGDSDSPIHATESRKLRDRVLAEAKEPTDAR